VTCLRILVIGDRAWGRGPTLGEALDNLKKSGGSRKCYIAYLAEADTYVDSMGYLSFPHHDNPPREFHRVGVKAQAAK
jgi:hypothetical protein